jgi:hypothetical protein
MAFELFSERGIALGAAQYRGDCRGGAVLSTGITETPTALSGIAKNAGALEEPGYGASAVPV